MDDLKTLGKSLLSGKNGPALRALAESEDAKRLSGKMDAVSAEKALRSGDPGEMRALLQKLLATPEGKNLAEKIDRLGGKP